MTGAEELFQLRDEEIQHQVGPETFRRGREYHARGMVESVGVAPNGTVTAQVMGSRGWPYVTLVSTRERGFEGFCNCPMNRQCKHVVATLLAARERYRPAPVPVAAQSDWESLLDELLPEEAVPEPGGRALALSVRAMENPYGGPAMVTFRPLARSARADRWVKTGARWRDLADRYYFHGSGERFNTHQLQAIRAFGDAVRSQPGGMFYSLPDELPLGDLGRDWIQLLHNCVRAGVAVLDDRSGQPNVEVCQEPGRIVGELVPPQDGRPASMSVQLGLPMERGAPWHPIAGAEAQTVGWVCIEPQRVTLVTAQEPLSRDRLDLLQIKQLDIPAEDWSRFTLTRLPALRRLVEFEDDAGLDIPAPTPRLLLRVTHHPGHQSEVAQSLQYVIDDGTPPLEVPLHPDGPSFRDAEAEGELLQRIRPALPLQQLWAEGIPGSLIPKAQASFRGLEVAELVTTLEALAGNDDVMVEVTGEPAEYAEATDGPTITIGTSDPTDDQQDWFDLSVTVTVGDEHVSLAALIQALAVGEEALLMDSGTWFSLDRPELHQLASALAEARMLQDKRSERLRLTPLHAGLWQELEAVSEVSHQSSRWQERVSALTDRSLSRAITLPSRLKAELRPYQVDGFRWLSTLWDAQLGGILADDMGLGKTLQVLAAVQRVFEFGELEHPVLIVCPTSVMSNWAREAERFTPDLGVAVVEQTRRKAGTTMEATVAGVQVVVTSYTLLRIDEAEFARRHWSALVLDEAQFVKNHAAKGHSAARRVQAERTFVLTGTPMENSLMDLWSMLALGAPGLYPRADRFKEHYVTPIERHGSTEMLQALRRRIRPLMLRRTKESVAAELPPKQETVLSVPLAAKHRTIYDKHLQRERQRILGLVDSDLDGNRIAIFRALTMLRQLSLDPGLVDNGYAGVAEPAKIELLVEQLQELAAEGHRALVFSTFTGFLKQVRARLAAEGIGHCYLDGRTRRRSEVLEEWRSGEAPAFLISLKAGGFGLTLTEADYVFVLDPWWNPAAELQAIDRAHRIGQTKPVNVYRLVSTDTIEEKVVALQQRKRDLFAKVIDDGAMLASGALTADDIRGLLS